jgi:nucleoid-associated protein YgaU
MKAIVRTVLLMSLVCSVALVASAQQMTKDQWQQAMREATGKRDAMLKEVESLEADVVKLKAEDATLTQQIGTCQQELMALLGTTTAKEKEFAGYLDRIDTYLNDLAKSSNQDLFMRRAELDTVQSMINRAQGDKLSFLPENAHRIEEEQVRLDMLRDSVKKIMAQSEQVYTVGTWAKDRDCLWNIAKKPKVYDNAFLWPKIWEENRDQIKNPDIIYPGEKLRIPAKGPLTAQEKRTLKSYWQQKSANAGSDRPMSPEKK